MTTQQDTDAAAITALTVRYCWALDQRRFEELHEVFAEECVADYGADRAMTSPEEIGTYFAKVLDLRGVDRCQHLVANHQVEVDGDTATSRCQYQSHYTTVSESGETHVEDVGGVYLDRLARTADGWRITERVVRTLWRLGGPDPIRATGTAPRNTTAFILAGTFTVRPELREELLAEAAGLVEDALKEPGVLDYALTPDAAPGVVRVHSRWRSEGDLRRHMDDPRVQELLRALGRAGFADSTLRRYVIREETPARVPSLPVPTAA